MMASKNDGASDGRTFKKTDIERILSSVLGTTLGEADIKGIFEKYRGKKKVTGIAGDVIEQSVFGCDVDTKQHPDFLVDGIPTELKTTGVWIRDGLWSAKEPITITAVSVNNIVKEEFYTSAFWHKAEHLLIVFYHYNSNSVVEAMRYSEFPIWGYLFHVFDEADVRILLNDWEIVRDFIREAQKGPDPESMYPLISTKLKKELMYIDTAPKWPKRPRFRLKKSFVTTIVQGYKYGTKERLPHTYNSYRELDNKCHEITQIYCGRTLRELADIFGVSIRAKNLAEQIVVRMFGGSAKKLNDIEQFSKAGVIAKSIKLSENDGRTEDTKLYKIDLDELLSQKEFEESDMYDYFSHQFLCIVSQETTTEKGNKVPNSRFIGFKRLCIPEGFVESEVRRTWNDARNTVFNGELKEIIEYDRNGEPLINKSGTIKSSANFPKSKDYKVFFRGSGTDGTSKRQILGVNVLTQYLWIKGTELVKMLKEEEYL